MKKLIVAICIALTGCSGVYPSKFTPQPDTAQIARCKEKEREVFWDKMNNSHSGGTTGSIGAVSWALQSSVPAYVQCFEQMGITVHDKDS